MTIQKAFITDDAFTVDDHGYAAVVTAKAIDRDTTGKMMHITCDILGYCEAVSITLNQDDLIAVRRLLDLPDMDTYFAAFDVALKALEEIANANSQVPSVTETWRNLALHCKAIAINALAKINGDADHGTPSDS